MADRWSVSTSHTGCSSVSYVGDCRLRPRMLDEQVVQSLRFVGAFMHDRDAVVGQIPQLSDRRGSMKLGRTRSCSTNFQSSLALGFPRVAFSGAMAISTTRPSPAVAFGRPRAADGLSAPGSRRRTAYQDRVRRAHVYLGDVGIEDLPNEANDGIPNPFSFT